MCFTVSQSVTAGVMSALVVQGQQLTLQQMCVQMHSEGAAQQLHHSPLPPPLLHIRSGAEHHHLPHPHSHPHLHEAVGLPVPGSARRSSGISSAGFGTLQLQSSPSMDTSSCRWVRFSFGRHASTLACTALLTLSIDR